MEPILIMNERLKCPACGKETLSAKDYLYETPQVGKLVLSNWECESCNFRLRDVKPYETQEPIRIELDVECEEDLSSLVYRSAFASMNIPELGVEIEPASASQGNLTTVRGLLEIVRDSVGGICEGGCEKIELAMDGRTRFRLVIDDPSGTSFIKNNKAKVTRSLSLFQQ